MPNETCHCAVETKPTPEGTTTCCCGEACACYDCACRACSCREGCACPSCPCEE